MLKKLLTPAILLLAMLTLSAASIKDEKLEDTFDSEKNLSLFNFNNYESDEKDFLDNTKFYLQTMAPGDEVYTWFGHSGLVVENKKYGLERCFDWGVFAFSPTFYIDFIFGRLYYSLMVSYPSYTIKQAENENRTLTRTELVIPIEAKKGIIDFLNYNALDENSTYLYHHYEDNCATRIRDIFNASTHGEFKKWATSINTGKSYRDYTTDLMGKSFPVNWTLNFLQGPSIDKKLTLWEACFLPDILNQAIEEYSNVTAVTVVAARKINYSQKSLLFESITIAIIIFVLLVWSYNSKRRLWALFTSILSLFLAILSCVLIFMMCFSNHDVTYFNENIIFVNPMLFLLFFSSIRTLFSREKREAKLSLSIMKIGFLLTLSLLILKGLFMATFTQDNLAQIFFMLIIYSSAFFRILSGNPR